MLTLLAIYAARWEIEAARQGQQHVAAEQSRLARLVRPVGEASCSAEKPRIKLSALAGRLTPVGYSGA